LGYFVSGTAGGGGGAELAELAPGGGGGTPNPACGGGAYPAELAPGGGAYPVGGGGIELNPGWVGIAAVDPNGGGGAIPDFGIPWVLETEADGA
jgi:hypothetical protein